MTRKSYSHTGRKEHPLDAAYWENCYAKEEVFWDHGEPSPGLVDFLRHPSFTPGKILVPGCGRGHDCRALAGAGFTVTGMDISAQGITEAKAMGGNVTWMIGDFLNPPAKCRGAFDWVFEHTCFCAIDPDQRDDYVRAVAAVLKPGGRLLGVFYNIQPETGPPFGTTRAELVERFSPEFQLVYETVPRSYPNREGKELLMLWEKTR